MMRTLCSATMFVMLTTAAAAGSDVDPNQSLDPFDPFTGGGAGGSGRPTAPSAPGGAGWARSNPRLGGRLEATVNGTVVAFPTLKTDVHADIAGDVASVTVVQTFTNPATQPMHATYLFPLNEEAAVFEMVIMVGGEVVRAQIREVEEARRTFEDAKRAGKSAALLSEHRPNLFTQEIANLMPNLPITVTIRYVQPLPRLDGRYELVVPLVVGPRYEPPAQAPAPATANPASNSSAPAGVWQLDAMPAQSPVFGLDIPDTVDNERVSLSIFLDGGMPIGTVDSPTHPISITESNGTTMRIELAEGRTLDNRDFVLRYQLGGDAVHAGMLAHQDSRGGFFSLLLEPPVIAEGDLVTPREMVFLLDCSGSMNGLPIEASKTFVRRALQQLRATDSFRIIRFSDSATELNSSPLPATPDNIARGLAYVDGLRGEGGTQMTSGIHQALDMPPLNGAVRIVVFLTDGYIGNEYEVLRLITAEMGNARLFAFGVGTAVNRFLLSQIGRLGRGFTRYMDPTENVEQVAAELADKLQSPVLTDIEIDWGGLAPTEVYPQRVPDLFAGHSIRVQGRCPRLGSYDIVVRGRINGRAASLPLRLQLSEGPAVGVGSAGPLPDGSLQASELDRGQHGDAVALVWARAAVADRMEEMMFPVEERTGHVSDADLQHQVTQLGLEYALVTRWTAFVAVSEHVVNNAPETALAVSVPVPMVQGLTPLAYPMTHLISGPDAGVGRLTAMEASSGGGGGGGFSGASSPEPATTTALVVAAAAGLAALRRRRAA